MEGSVLRLAIFAVFAMAVIYIILGFFSEPQGNETQFKTGLDYAEGTIGKNYKYDIKLSSDTGFSAARLDSGTRNVRFECSSADTCYSGKITISPRLLKVNEDTFVQAYFRCVRKEIINDCVIYFGDEPAQLEINGLIMNEKFGRGESAQIDFEVLNTGSLNAENVQYRIGIYQEKTEGGTKNRVLSVEITGNIQRIESGSVRKITEHFTAGFSGKYAAKITVEGEDAGYALAEKEFTVTDAVSNSCSAASKAETSIESEICRTQYTCSGCETGAECKIRWIGKGIDANTITEAYPTGIYTQTPAVSDNCP
ncbi:MAG TPA: hypothetical protein VJH23_04945 [archaeon]|nr:hypothetical protein [archaeon]